MGGHRSRIEHLPQALQGDELRPFTPPPVGERLPL
jgi:hypothetical protein